VTLSIDLVAFGSFIAAINAAYLALIAWWEDRSLLATRLFVALALVAAWSAFWIAFAYSGFGVQYPRFFLLSQLLSGFTGPLMFLFTLAFTGRFARWGWRHTGILSLGGFGTLGFLWAAFAPLSPGEVEQMRAVLQAYVGGANINPVAQTAAILRGPFGLLQGLHSLQLLGFGFASVGVYLTHAAGDANQEERSEARFLALLYASFLIITIFTNVLPRFGASAIWPRLFPVLLLPFVVVLWTVLNRRVKSAKRLLKERETLISYLPSRAVDTILANQGAVRGQRMQAAVLFTDLRNFTTLSEQVDPATLVAWIDRFFARMSDLILHEEGMIDKLIGDAILAVFGVPDAQPDACEKALRAAERMQQELRQMNHDDPLTPGVTVEMGIGIHYGMVIAGTVGRAQRTFTVFGDTVNTASRLEGKTKELGCPLLVSAAFAAQLAPASQAALTPLGPIELKGKRHEVEVLARFSEGAGGDYPRA
jgi:class 3 adenylate cyclase